MIPILLRNKAVIVRFLWFLCLLWGLVFFSSGWAKSPDHRPDIMLLKPYHSVDLTQGQWVWSEKFDGVRAFWDGHDLLSRGGKVIHAPAWFLAALPPFAIDGELWSGRGQFAQTVSIVRQQQPDSRWRQIHYQIFEVPNQPGGLKQRLAKLRTFLQRHPVSFIHIIAQHPVNREQALQKAFHQVIQRGGEGLVVRRADLPYQTGRLATALKLKPFEEAECEVVGYRPGKGKYQGKVGSLICQMSNGQNVRLGSGLTDALRAHPPKIGTVVTFKFMGKTQQGHPRHPVFLRIRQDADLQGLKN